jgi:hypothetical protein
LLGVDRGRGGGVALSPLDDLDVLVLTTERLDRAAIPYMITGSIAASHFGRPRMTRDIDIVVAVTEHETDALLAALGDEFLCHVDGARAAVARRGMFNAIHSEAVIKVDFIVRKADPFRRQEFERRRRVTIAGHEVWMVAPEDLILSKLVWAHESESAVQWADVRSVIRIQGEALDWAYLQRWAEQLGVAERLRELQ